MKKNKFDRKVSIMFTQSIFEKLEQLAFSQQKTISSMIREILFNYLRKEK